MNKKRILLLGIISLVLISSIVYAQARQNVFENVFGAIAGERFNLGELYSKYGNFIDFIIYLVVFIGLAQISLSRIEVFQSRAGKAVIVAIGTALAVAMGVWTSATGWNLGKLGGVSSGVFLLVVFLALYYILKHLFGEEIFTGKGLAACIAFLVVWYSALAIAPDIIKWIVNIPVIGGLLEAAVGLILLYVIIVGVLWASKKFKGVGAVTGVPVGAPGTEDIKKEEEQNIAGDEEIKRRTTGLEEESKKLGEIITSEDVTAEQADKALDYVNKVFSQLDKTTDPKIQDQLLEQASKGVQVAADSLEAQQALADKILEEAKKEEKEATDVAGEAQAQRVRERKTAREEKAAGQEKISKQSKEAGGVAYTERSKGRIVRRKTKQEEKEAEKVKTITKKELELLRKIKELIEDLHTRSATMAADEKRKKQNDLKILLKKIYGAQQKVTIAKNKLKKVHGNILGLEVSLENAEKIKENLDLLKVQELKKK
jgi:hypothetical protein